MDILIKSYNRPYYLDRCLFSIRKHVSVGNGKIVVLDDGTPKVYLDRIIEKYPNIIIKKSGFYDEKVKFTSEGKRPEKYIIPIDLWIEAASEASENFILIEDDTWFIDNINLDEINDEVMANNVVLTKLYWVGNPIINQNRKETPLKHIVLLKPRLMTVFPALYYAVFYKFDRFKIRKILPYYKIYAVAGMVFNKNYFTRLWDNHKSSIDEGLQIYNAVRILNKQKDQIQFARYNHEILKTGFMSAATNQHKEEYAGDIDMFVFNKLLNDAWLQNQFDVTSSLPNDIEIQEITKILEANPQASIASKDWQNWVNSFKGYYIKIGCKID